MVKKKKKKSKNRIEKEKNESSRFSLPGEIKQIIFGVSLILLAILVSLSFFDKAGLAGRFFMKWASFLVGEAVFIIPFFLLLGGVAFLRIKGKTNFFSGEKEIFWPIILGVLILASGSIGILGTVSPGLRNGGWIGYILSWPFLNYFGSLAARIIFIFLVIIGGLILWQFIMPKKEKKKEEKQDGKEELEGEKKEGKSFMKKIFAPKFKVKEIDAISKKRKEESFQPEVEKQPSPVELEAKPIKGGKISNYQAPPINLLDKGREVPTSGNTKENSAIIKKTLHNFGIDVVMSEINIGPTVTQYTLKPADGVKLSKITNLSNNLSLALASHPIRIEAPIPGRSLVGIEIPNKVRASVRLRDLIENENFQKSPANLLIALGRDVSGMPTYADLTKMPHLLVAGSTGSGKTIFLNSLIISLLYQPTTFVRGASPENLRFILVDPKRVEFPVYNDLPHLLCPVIYDAPKTISALRWLTGEMERRFDVLSEVQARDIKSFNELALKSGEDPLPFIVVIIDELADLMAAKGREIESGIVRLAQMARAVGIHLVVATQRPSVEVITGLIKANITSRVTFKVASQIDSRTILDTSGAERLLGSGDMLYLSSQTPKPKRVQAAYLSDKEVKRTIKYIVKNYRETGGEAEMDEKLIEELERSQVGQGEGGGDSFAGNGDDSLYEEAKQLVVETRKASASFLQRKLRIGYARAARLIDMLEDKGVVGPADGAKPREVYGIGQEEVGSIRSGDESGEGETEEGDDGWEKI